MRVFIIVTLVVLGVGIVVAILYLTHRRHDRASNLGQARNWHEY